MKSYNSVPELVERQNNFQANFNLPKDGDVVHCEQCDTPMYKYLRDQQIGEVVFAIGNIEFIGNTPTIGEQIRCDNCGNDRINPYNVRSR